MQHQNLDWTKVESLVDNLTTKIKSSSKKYEWIIGINRGGLIPSVLLSHKLNIAHGVCTVQSYVGQEKKELKSDLYISMIGFIKPFHNILLVDDIADSGDSIVAAHKNIKKIDSDAKNIDTLTLFYKNKSIVKPTYYAEEIANDMWVNFPWEVNG